MFDWFGAFSIFCARTLRFALTPPYEWREMFRQMDEMGSKSVPLVALAGAAAVRQYLAEKFKLDDSRIKTRGMGEDFSAGGPEESTVEVLVYPPGYEKSVASASAPR